ncbi:MAG: hypothetical protein Q8941_11590 [Bacteroidota bacterium]|nr:hypothetical protein [Bacteroidota bacterium]
MRKIFLLCLLIPVLGIGQNKNVVNTFRVFPKPEKNAEFEKALTAHAQKYHTGDWKWRVFEIQTGPESGGFQVNEGPLSWEQFDGRGDLGAEHTADWNKNVAPFTTSQGAQSYASFNAELSTVQLTDYADKIVINHIFPKPGMINNITEMIKKLKKAWAAGNESVAVYNIVNSGAPQIVTVTRLKAGLKELDESFRKSLQDRFNAANGEGSWNYWLEEYAKNVESRWSEMLLYRADLSSK